jgi:hypothetical protein
LLTTRRWQTDRQGWHAVCGDARQAPHCGPILIPLTRDRRLALGLPALLAVLLFARVLGGEYVYDDRVLLSENPRMQSLAAVGDAFAMPYWELADDQRDAAGFYRPVGATVLTASWAVSGGAPWFLHLVSLLLHAGCAAAVGALALAMGWRATTAAAAGALFAVHGAHVEAVAWVSAIPELLATLFSVLALRALVLRRIAWTATWLLLAMLSKEASFGVWLLCGGLVLLRGEVARVRAIATLAAPAAIVYLLRAQAFGDEAGWSWAAGFDRVTTHHGLSGLEQLTLSGSLLGRYLLYLVWPWPHRPFDPLRLDLAWNDAARLLPAGAVPVRGALPLPAVGGLLPARRGTAVQPALADHAAQYDPCPAAGAGARQYRLLARRHRPLAQRGGALRLGQAGLAREHDAARRVRPGDA